MKKYVKLFCCLYLAGFAAGICGLYFMVKNNGYQTSLLPVYLSAFPQKAGNAAGVFGELLWQKGKLLFLGLVCGMTCVGVPAVAVCILWLGFMGGSLAGVFFLEYGVKGMILNFMCMFPQSLFYIPGCLLLFFAVMQMSQKYWEKRKIGKEDYKAYFFFLSGAGMLILLGVWMESYVNQSLMQYILSKWI